jgi:acyl transferase domain-containing protein/NAD(P)-dependent dehydrogenase (short-subunit alcohol dehydrogenase family)
LSKPDQDRENSPPSTPLPTPVPLAIIGIGCMFPKADNSEAFWANIKGGVDAVTDIPASHWRPEDYFDGNPASPDMTYARRGAFLEPIDFNPLEFGITPNNIEATDTTQLLGMVVAQQALRDAGYATGKDSNDGRPFNRERTSVILGVTGALEMVIPLGARLGHPIWRKALKDAGVEKTVADDVVQRISDSYVPWQENSFPGLLGNVAAGRIANRFDLGGTNCVVDAACASSLGALHMAAMELYAGRSEMAITGGIDTFNDIFMYMCFSKTPALSPTGSSRPFSAGADGTILGEGLGVIVLKRLADAQRDGDHIRAVIRSIGSSSDGKGNAVYAPSAEGQVRCLLSAYGQAGFSPQTIELVEAHGTGTKVGDAVEAKALDQVYRNGKGDGTWCALGSVKSMVGHTKAAAGIAGLIKAALALDHKVLPPTIKVDQPLENIEPGKAALYVNTEKRPWLPRADHPRRAGVSAFGFGGSNFHCVLEEAQSAKTEIDWDDSVRILSFCADSREQLAKALTNFDASRSWKQMRIAAADLRATFRSNAACRLAIVLQKNHSDASKLINSAQHMLAQHPDRATWTTPDGIYFGARAAGQLAAIFPGQGSQYVGMLRDLACQFPQMLDALTEAETAFGNHAYGERLSDRIYPIPVFTDAARKANEQTLADTRIAQPAIGAVSLGAWHVLTHFGIQANAAAGHSFGELVALCAAGRIDGPSLHKMASVRGNAMANISAAPGTDAGSMLAVMAPLPTIEQFIAVESLSVIIANKNAPDQVVLSGATAEIDRAAQLLDGRSVRNRKLPVSAAFHSPLVANARVPFANALQHISIAAGHIPVFSNTTAEVYPADAAHAAALLASQLACPVEFVRQIEKMYASGVRTFLEVGPGGKLSGLVRAILQGRDHDAVALDASGGKKSGVFDLACTLGHLAALGHEVDLARWDESFARQPRPPESKKPAMAVRLTGANYVKPRPVAAPRKPVVVAPVAQTPVVQEKREGLVPLQQKPQTLSPSMTPSIAAPAPAASPALAQALQATQQGILALQKMQEQTAQLHHQYLHGQEQAQRTIHQLMEQQMMLLGNACGINLPAATLAPLTAPAPIAYAPPAAAIVSWQPQVLTNGPSAQHIEPVAQQPEPAKTAAPVAIAQPTPAPAVSDERTQTVLLQVIAEKTGYPVEMLELDMTLDTDLGIDSIKRVEILSALQSQLPDAPVVKPEDLGRLQTLRQIVAFLADAPAQPKTAAAPAPAAVTATVASSDQAQTVLLEVVADKTGYPVEMLELDMSLDTDLGIDSIKRVEILSALQTRLPEAPVVKPEDLGRLQTLRQIVAFLDAGAAAPQPAKKPIAPTAPVIIAAVPTNGHAKSKDVLDRQVLTVVPLNGQTDRPMLPLPKGAVIWVSDDGNGLAVRICQSLKARHLDAQVVNLDAVPGIEPIAGLLMVAPNNPPHHFIQHSFKLMQRVGPLLREAGKTTGAFLASASSLDGSFGLNGHTPRNPLTGGLAGLVKTASHEWPEVSCKSLDIAHDLHDADQIAEQIADELLIKGPAEVGISSTGRCETRLVRKSLNGEVGQPSLTANDVVVVTGGARGVTAAVSIAIAKSYGCKLLLLGRSPAPAAEPAWLAGLTEESQIKKAYAVHLKGNATPRLLEDEFRRVMADREVRDTLAQIEAIGTKVMYKSLDVRDTAAVKAAIADARTNLGPIRGIIHGAGVLQDRLIEQKTAEQFDAVFSTKVGGFNALLHAVQEDDIKVIVAFSSTTGRFGRKGQIAYAAANEVLNKLAQQEAHQRPGCRVLSMNWGPWEGGMVTPQLRRIFENEGVGLIPLQAGADYLVREMATPAGGPVEILILGPDPKSNGSSNGHGHASTPHAASMVVAFERTLDIESHPVLRSHIIKGKAVLPTALIVEWLAHGAMHENPGLLFHGFDDLRILKGITLKQKESLPIRVLAGPATSHDGFEVIPVELRSGNVLHARASIILASHLPTATAAEAPVADQPYSCSNDAIYTDGRLFHGPDLQAIKSIQGWSDEGMIAESAAAPASAAWMRQPLRSGWLADPLALDAAFQLMILWCFETRGIGSLPTSAASYRQYARTFPQAGTRIHICVLDATDHTVTAAIEFLDHAGKLLARMDGYECVMDATLESAFALNQLAQ